MHDHVRTQWVGILNLTPDSFSDGGSYGTHEAVMAHVEQMLADGASVIDVGAESTRPHAQPLSYHEEWERLSPHLADIVCKVHDAGAVVSLDTRHAPTAQRAIDYGVDWINDVSGGASPALVHAVRDAPHVRYVVMHSLSIPADPQIVLPEEQSVCTALDAFFSSRLAWLAAQGIDASRIILDVGLGFGKSKAQSLELLWSMPYFKKFSCPLLVGHSRKSMFSLCAQHPSEHEALTLLASSYLMHHHIDYLRVHNVRRHATLSTELSTWAVHKV
jgi:dihydropteroate synthase